MPGTYIASKADSGARAISAMHGVDYRAARAMIESVWEEAGRCILRQVSAGEWQRLSLKDKSFICAGVIKGLLDKKAVEGYLSGRSNSLVSK